MTTVREIEKIETHDVLKALGTLAVVSAIVWMIIYFIRKG